MKPHHRTHRTRGRDMTPVRGGTTENIIKKKTISRQRTPVVGPMTRRTTTDCLTARRSHAVRDGVSATDVVAAAAAAENEDAAGHHVLNTRPRCSCSPLPPTPHPTTTAP